MTRIMLYNHSGCENRGCEAIVRSTAALFAREGASVTVASRQPAYDRALHMDGVSRIVSMTIAPYSVRRFGNSVGFRVGMARESEVARRYAPCIVQGKRSGVCLSVGGDTYCYGYQEHMAVINGEMTPEETTIAENRGSSQAILDYLKDPQNVTEETLGGWHFYESRIIGLGASIDALEKNGNAEWITPKYPPTTPTSEQKKATLDKTELEAYVAIVTGAQPIDYFDTFASEWKRLGGDAIAQEVQEYFAQ